jgi:hypothetical protein
MIKFKINLNITKIFQIITFVLIFLGITAVVFTSLSIYNSYLNSISIYESGTVSNKQDLTENSDYKNFESIIKKVENKTTSLKTETINNIFD